MIVKSMSNPYTVEYYSLKIEVSGDLKILENWK